MSEAEQTPQPFFNLERVYLKDASVEVPNAPAIFFEQEVPKIEVQLQNRGNQVGEGVYEGVLTITVTAKINERTVYLTEVAQAGLFRINNIPPETMELVLQITCPTILFPYAREAVASMIGRAGFAPLHLAPVNFEALYQQQRAQAAAQAAAPQTAAH